MHDAVMQVGNPMAGHCALSIQRMKRCVLP
jgi:hypothetical protein